MTENAYRPGTWFAAIAPRVAVLVDDHVPPERLYDLWQAALSSDNIDDLLRAVTGGQTGDPPAFGLVVVDGMSVRVFVRAGVTALVVNGSGEMRSIDSGGISTRVEYVAGDVTKVTLGRAGAPAGIPSLPISAGVVAADSLDWLAPPVPEPGSIEAEVLGLDLLPTTIELPRIHEVPLTEADVPPVHDEPAAVDDGPPADDARPPDDAPAADDATAATAAAGDELLEDTMSDPDLVTAEPNGSGDHDGFTIARATLDALRPPPVAVHMIQAISCSQLHFNAPQAQRCRFCGEALQEQEPVVIPRPSMGMLQFSTGQLVELDRRVVVGRSPSAERVSGDDLPQLVQVESPEQDISRSHVEVRLDGWHVVLVDLDSVNGTVVTLPGRSPERLHPREPYPLVPGAVVDLAGEVTFRFEVPT
jgi:hypothetical protein